MSQKIREIAAFIVVLGLFASFTLIQADCVGSTLEVVQSIPIDLAEPAPGWKSTYESWKQLIRSATSSIDIACYYMSLTDGSLSPPSLGGWMGQDIFNELILAGRRGVRIRIVQQKPSPTMPDHDTQNLTRSGLATVRSIDFTTVMKGQGGILHTKMLIVDTLSAYIGSANTDWRSLSQVKEVGITVTSCPIYAQDAGKIFSTYWLASEHNVLPQWPSDLNTEFNWNHPMEIHGPQGDSFVYLASSPPEFSPSGRDTELKAIIDIINSAKKTLTFSVMDYIPTTLYMPAGKNFYWPPIDDALRSAAYRGVQVQLLFSIWNSTRADELMYWKSLGVLKNINVKTLRLPLPPAVPPAPFSRVVHSKYLVTEDKAYVTTSNCAGDYYLLTGGVSVNFLPSPKGPSPAIGALKEIFHHDWTGPYAFPVPDSLPPRA